MDLNELLVFARVIQAGSFTAAARGLRMPKSTVSRKVSELEERVGAQLLQRTTRQLRLTEVGSVFYEHCARIVAEAEQAEQAVTRMQAAPHGLLRVTLPLSFGVFGPIIAEFLRRHPEVQVELLCTDRMVDLVGEGFDLAVRAGKLVDSSLMARRLGSIERIVVASPEYLQRRGTPKTPRDLEKHDCLLFGTSQNAGTWALSSGNKTVEVPVTTRLSVNEPDMLRAMALASTGIALMPNIACVDDVGSGRLRRVLPDWTSAESAVHAIYPSSRHHAPKVMAFVEVARELWDTPWKRLSHG
ncbi:MAG: LysR family transcriptional regulator [Cystobacter sp.]